MKLKFENRWTASIQTVEQNITSGSVKNEM